MIGIYVFIYIKDSSYLHQTINKKKNDAYYSQIFLMNTNIIFISFDEQVSFI